MGRTGSRSDICPESLGQAAVALNCRVLSLDCQQKGSGTLGCMVISPSPQAKSHFEVTPGLLTGCAWAGAFLELSLLSREGRMEQVHREHGGRALSVRKLGGEFSSWFLQLSLSRLGRGREMAPASTFAVREVS